jgi:hypothetical protein
MFEPDAFFDRTPNAPNGSEEILTRDGRGAAKPNIEH